MKGQLLMVFALFIGHVLNAQTVTFQPKWKVGDKRTAIITDVTYEYKNGELSDSTYDVLPVKYEVQKETATAYTVKITMNNVALSAAQNFYDKLGEELKGYKDLVLIYQINKIGGTAELLNWKEAQAYVKQSFGEMEKLVKKKVPDAAEYVKLVFNPILKLFSSKETIEAYMESEMKIITLPFGHAFTVGDTLRETETEANPFDPTSELSVTHAFYLLEKDKTKGLYTLDYAMEFDMAPFVAMMKNMMSELGKSLGVEDSTVANKNAELDDINFEMTNNTQWLFDSKSTWPISMAFVSKITATGQGKSRLKVQERTVTFK